MAKPKPSRSLLWRFAREHVTAHWRLLSLALVLMIIDGGAYAMFAGGVRSLIDDGLLAKSAGALHWIAAFVVTLFVVRAFAAFSHRAILRVLGLKVVGDMQVRLVSHLLGLDARFYQNHPPGELIERVRGDTTTLQQVITTAIMSLGRDSVSVVAMLAIILYTDWVWALIVLVGAPLVVLPMAAIMARVRQATKRARTSAADLTQRLDEIFHGHKSVRANNRQSHESERSRLATKDYVARQSWAEVGQAALPSMIDLMAGFGIAAVLLFGLQDVLSGDKTLGEFATFFAAIGLLFDPARRLSSVVGQLQVASASLERIYGLLAEVPHIQDAPDPQPLAAPGGDLCFEDLHFSYAPDKPVLQGLSFTAPAGKMTAIVGPSGAGKSTLFGLLARFEEPDSGRISIGGQDIRAVSLADLRANMALVNQETALFNESLAYNIAYGADFNDAKGIAAAADKAQVRSFQPDLETSAGPRGEALSGGQRQRVVIARAIMRQAPILLLDEATAALDSATEQQIQAALKVASQGRTSLVIAHRLSTIKEADLIVVMEAGRVAESGTHDELVAHEGAYWRLLQTQQTLA